MPALVPRFLSSGFFLQSIFLLKLREKKEGELALSHRKQQTVQQAVQPRRSKQYWSAGGSSPAHLAVGAGEQHRRRHLAAGVRVGVLLLLLGGGGGCGEGGGGAVRSAGGRKERPGP